MTYPGIQCSPGKLLLVMAVCKTTASQLRICGSVRPLTVLSYTLLVITSVSVENGHQLPYVCVYGSESTGGADEVEGEGGDVEDDERDSGRTAGKASSLGRVQRGSGR